MATSRPEMRAQRSKVRQAIEAWKRVLGARYVLADTLTLKSAETATFRTTQRVCAVLRPRNRAEVQSCLRIASTFGVPVHPVSRGKNWGYGSRVPYRDTSAILDLGRMNRIVAFDEQLAYITVEPGVTFKQVEQFLRNRRSKLYMSNPGTTPEASPLANAVERGIGRGLLADRFLYSCGMEVVLSSGACTHTGFARFPGALTAKLHRAGVGPSLDGLFSQSSLGVVTQITLWLARLPAMVDRLLLGVNSGRSLGKLVDKLQELHALGLLIGPTKIFNDYRRLGGGSQYPWALAKGKAPLLRKTLDTVLGKDGRRAWLAMHSVGYVDKQERSWRRRHLREELSGKCDEMRFKKIASSLRNHFGPDQIDVASTYWRKRTPVPSDIDPDRDHCGVIFTAPLVPFTGKHVMRAARTIEQHVLRAGFEPMITITMLDPRVAYLVAPIYYDRDVPGQDAKAGACANAMLRVLEAQGYFPYRTGLQSNPNGPGTGESVRIYSALRSALDPAGVLGRNEAAGGVRAAPSPAMRAPSGADAKKIPG